MRCAIAALVILAWTSGAWAAAVTLKEYSGTGYTFAETFDTKVSQYNNTEKQYNSGGRETLDTIYHTDSRAALVQFDLASVFGGADVTAVASATLRMYRYSNSFNNALHSVAQVGESWVEGSSQGEWNHVCDGAQWLVRNSGTLVETDQLVDNGDGTWYSAGVSDLADDPFYVQDPLDPLSPPKLHVRRGGSNYYNAQDAYAHTNSQAELLALGATRGYYYDAAADRLYVNMNDSSVRWYANSDYFATAGAGIVGNYVLALDTVADPFPAAGEAGWVAWDVTDIVSNWLVGGQDNYGFRMVAGAHTESSFYSSEYVADPTLRPELIIDYTVGGVVNHPGDANGDLVVNVQDLSILATNWGSTTATFAQGDFNDDQTVNVQDLSILATNWGWDGTGGAVPEPVSLALLGLGGLALIRRRR